MENIPIRIVKVTFENSSTYNQNSDNQSSEYLFRFEEKGVIWEKAFTCDKASLIKFRNEIDKLTEALTTCEFSHYY
jgi:hypothetical protein